MTTSSKRRLYKIPPSLALPTVPAPAPPIHPSPTTPTMPPKRTPIPSSLPTPAPENISNREYYHTSSTTDTSPHSNELMDFPTDPSPPPEKQQDGSGERSAVQSKDASGNGEAGFVELSHPDPPSPSPSDIVAGSKLEDVQQLGDLERRTRGLERGERKKALFALQERLGREREERERRGAEERDVGYEEVQRKGREDV